MLDVLSKIGGFLFCVAFFLVIITCCYIAISDRIEKIKEKRARKYRYEATREVGRRLKTTSYWFDDRATHLALQLIGASLCEHGTYDDDAIRKLWKTAVAKEEANKSMKGNP